MKAHYAKGEKQEAVAIMRDFKSIKADFDQILLEHPDVKD